MIALSRKQDNNVSFKLVPNPVGKDQQLLAVLHGLQEGASLLSIEDVTGRVISKRNIFLTESNQIEFIDLNESIEKGCYMVTLITPYEKVSAKLIVQ